MAIITEQEEKEEPTVEKESPELNSTTTPLHNKPTNTNPFIFWFYFTLAVSLVTFLFVSFSSSVTSQDPKSWFLSLPDHLRHHYSNGRIIKVQPNPNHTPIELFTFEQGDTAGLDNVVIVHGLGLSSYSFREMIQSLSIKGVRAIAIDLPGSGFSDKSTLEVGKGSDGFFGRFWDVYSVIQEKGLFWAFDEIVATGEMPYEEMEKWVSSRKTVRVVELGSEEMSRVLGQVIDSMKLPPVNLILHDSALGMCANWVLKNSESIRSITLLDTASRSLPALPLWVFNVPIIREIVFGFPGAYSRFISIFCSKSIGNIDLESHRLLLNGRDGRKAIVAMANRFNFSFDMAEWGSSEGLKDVPMQVIWSSNLSEEWSKEGLLVADALPQAKFVEHSGGRWPQADKAEELAGKIVHFISSLPKLIRQVEKEPIPEHNQKMFDETNIGDCYHDHHYDTSHADHHHHNGHDHEHGGDFMNVYGLGHGFAA